MSVLGQKLKRRGDKAEFTVTGADAGDFILTPVKFGTPIRVAPDVLAAEYGAKNATPPPSEEDVLAARDAAAVADHVSYFTAGRKPRPARPHTPGSPEAVFAANDPDHDGTYSNARNLAVKLLAVPDARARYELGGPIHPAVMRVVDKLLAAEYGDDA
jgi:hypothetical protein